MCVAWRRDGTDTPARRCKRCHAPLVPCHCGRVHLQQGRSRGVAWPAVVCSLPRRIANAVLSETSGSSHGSVCPRLRRQMANAVPGETKLGEAPPIAGNRPGSLGLAQSGSVWLSLARSGSVWLISWLRVSSPAAADCQCGSGRHQAWEAPLMAGNRPRSLGLAQSGSVWLSLARSGSVWLVHARADSFFCILSWNNLEGELRDQRRKEELLGVRATSVSVM